MTTGPNTLVGKLSFWAFLMMFLTWLARQILAYLFIIITPWLNWLIGWGVLIGAILLGFTLLFGGIAIYFAVRSWSRRREESKKENAAA
ncbi:MAG: hypothetical protein HY819_01695 [Acidobacteria bacterium]|nr:hypothetical protein [Acidobacteriota bacterium]